MCGRSGRGRAGFGALLAGLSVLLAPLTALGGEDAEPHPAYAVERGCSPRSAWLSGLRERLPPLLRTHPSLGSLSVRVARVGHGAHADYVGEVTSTADVALGSARSVHGETCEEVLDALSFMAALSLERTASSGTLSKVAEAAHSTELVLDPQRNSVEADAQGVAAAEPGGPTRVRLGAGAIALFQGKLTPGQPVAIGVAARLAWSTPGWQPLLLLGVYTSFSEQHRLEGGGSVRFEHASTNTVACPFRFPEGGTWGVRPCLDLDVGRSSGAGLGVPGAERHSAPWLSAGAQLRAEVVLWDRLELVASAGAVAPLWHAHFFLLPDVQSFTTPALGLRVGSFASVLF